MDIKNSKEIVDDVIERYNFSSVFAESELPFGSDFANLRIEPASAVRFLLSSALTGNKVLGFFNEVPFFQVRRPLRGECILIAKNIPEFISAPVVFCREAWELSDKLSTSLKVSLESKLPVIFVMSDNAANNFADFIKTSCDLGRTSPYLHPNVLRNILDEAAFGECVKNAESILEAAYPQRPFEEPNISFKDPKYGFFDYLLPGRPTKALKSLKGKTVSAPESEAALIAGFINRNYQMDIRINSLEEKKPYEKQEFLCPGCPFVNIFARAYEADAIFFTDIQCEGILKTFPLRQVSIDEYSGFLSDNLKVKTLFIGQASSYKPYYGRLFKNGKTVFLNDCGMTEIDICDSIRHPKKFVRDKNILYPYSCNNIKKYSPIKIKSAKCGCLAGGEGCVAIEKTKCPAFYFRDGKISVDQNLCTGCLACKVICKTGAVS